MNLQGLDRALIGLGPYLDDLVLCGGWTWYLYRRLLGEPGPIRSEFTRDLDCIGQRGMRVHGQLAARRLQDAGFQWSPRRGHTPPAARFAWPNAEHPQAEIEFLTAARGAGTHPTEELQEGLVAQTLRHLDILTDSPLDVTINEGGPLSEELEFRGVIRVPQIGAFAVQKSLIVAGRNREEQVKDFFYVADVIDTANGLADRLLTDVQLLGQRWPNEVATFAGFLDRRSNEPVFLREVIEQYPPEVRPPEPYVREEVRRWSARFKEELNRAKDA